jgi:hypothetical protein
MNRRTGLLPNFRSEAGTSPVPALSDDHRCKFFSLRLLCFLLFIPSALFRLIWRVAFIDTPLTSS